MSGQQNWLKIVEGQGSLHGAGTELPGPESRGRGQDSRIPLESVCVWRGGVTPDRKAR